MVRKIIALGSNGYFPSFDRHTMSYMLLDDTDEVLILDAGSGICRLCEPELAEIINSKRRLNIVLSHYHVDHVIGLSYLPGIWSGKPVRLYAPSEPYVEAQGEEAVNKFLNPPLFPLSFEAFPCKSELIPVFEPRAEIGDHSLEFIKLNHPGGSMGIRVDNQVCYMTDTSTSEAFADFVADCPYLLHETWMTRKEIREAGSPSSGHSVLEDVIELSVKAKVKNLIPIHLNPKWSEETLVRNLGRFENDGVNIILALDRQTITCERYSEEAHS